MADPTQASANPTADTPPQAGTSPTFDIELPACKHSPDFLMYPCAETARGQPDWLDPVRFAYRITKRFCEEEINRHRYRRGARRVPEFDGMPHRSRGGVVVPYQR